MRVRVRIGFDIIARQPIFPSVSLELSDVCLSFSSVYPFCFILLHPGGNTFSHYCLNIASYPLWLMYPDFIPFFLLFLLFSRGAGLSYNTLLIAEFVLILT